MRILLACRLADLPELLWSKDCLHTFDDGKVGIQLLDKFVTTVVIQNVNGAAAALWNADRCLLAVSEKFSFLQEHIRTDVARDRKEPVLAGDNQRRSVAHRGGFDRVDEVADPIIAVTDRPIGVSRSRPKLVLGVIGLDQMNQQQVGRVLLQQLCRHADVEPVSLHAATG